jgi:RNA recognition motif-containing protein
MSKKIYVGNLDYKVTEEELREIFEKIGETQSVKIITDVVTGRSKGFGFVEMSSNEDAEKAISTLNGTTLLGRPLTVNEARPQQPRGARGFGDRQGKSSRRGSGPGNWR